jgi:hypothetical protein
MLIHPFVPSARATSPCDPTKSAQTVPLPNGSKSADREHLCRIFLKKPSFSGRDFLPSWAHKSDFLLYQILVLTDDDSLGPALWSQQDPEFNTNFPVLDKRYFKSMRDVRK